MALEITRWNKFNSETHRHPEGVALCKESSQVLYKPRPARDDSSEPFLPFHRALRECSQWDELGHRFLVSIFDGGIGAVPVPKDPSPENLIGEEEVLVATAPFPHLSNLGFRIDHARNRVVGCASDKFHYALSTVVAYDYDTWETLFVIKLQEGADNKSLADDLTIDADGHIYVTDTYNGKIWKINADGSDFCVFSDDPQYQIEPINKYYGWVKLNGIAYHPHGFLLVTHLASHSLFKVSMDGKTVTKVGGLTRELLGDGIVLQDPNTLVMCGLDVGVHVLKTTDDWNTAAEALHSPAKSSTLIPTSVSLKHGKPYVGFANLTPEDPPVDLIASPEFSPLSSV
ncbi:hypothetical protein KP509_08G052000 [Ceratopteris richardii]|uniref:SMP-30/Gluconolactonase/LRE-like region domain-containing protein n=1 Tax=Ceratopteris richardii TaxID=49495 RepID=A0A8T2UAG0_CERRI|nr:hypothetical protein KP509_1Z039900 [Ceratopteris richardii]KAH7431500.1 hypothetical protein KP509_08G052000 [Ceratopteris richardii]